MRKVWPSSCIDGIEVWHVIHIGDDLVGKNAGVVRLRERLVFAVYRFLVDRNDSKKVELHHEAICN